MYDNKIWFKDIQNLIRKDNFLNFVPTGDMSYVEQINSIVRFAIYLTLILLLFKNNYKVFYILIAVLLVSYAMYTVDSNKKKESKNYFVQNNLAVSKKTNKICKKPSTDNPFMNRNLLSEYNEETDKEACDIQNESVKEDMSQKFNDKLYRSTDDIFMNHASDRQFYTVPNTDIVSDQKSFAEWLYKRPSCKGGDTQACYSNASEVIGRKYN
jgi:hypothetical protein